jgi:hypothetical protein
MALIGLSALEAGVAHASGQGGFCEKPVVRELGKPLAALPKIHRLPTSGHLPFAPPAVEVQPAGLNGVLVGAGQAGVVLLTAGSVRLDWDLHMTLVRVNHEGDRRGRVRQRNRRIRQIGDQTHKRAVGIRVSSKPSLYRFDVTIRTKAGEWLGHYSEYFRVVAKEVKVDIALSAESYPPGGTLLARMRNLGTATIFYGFELSVERWAGSEWVVDPSTPTGWPLIGLGLYGGAVGECEKVVLGGSLGEYRINKAYATSPVGHETMIYGRFRIE